MLFHFQLAPVADIAPWTTPSRGNEKSLHWFGMTDGCYWLDVGGTELFHYSETLIEHWAREFPEDMHARGTVCHHYVDYYVVRLWEDILDMLPAVLEPVPGDLAAYLHPGGLWGSRGALKDWSEKAYRLANSTEDDPGDIFEQATHWRWARQLDTAYLNVGPGIWIWREDERIHIRWDNRNLFMEGLPAWSAQSGESSLVVEDFVDEVRSFDRRLIEMMAERVDAVRHDWPHPDVRLDWEGLRRDHRQRSGWFENALVRSPVRTDWNGVRAALAELEQREERLKETRRDS